MTSFEDNAERLSYKLAAHEIVDELAEMIGPETVHAILWPLLFACDGLETKPNRRGRKQLPTVDKAAQ
jgi:hypothetical protein